MIRINKIKFNNILSYGSDNELIIENRVTQLIGENGAGKSSIPTILEEALYNKNSRGIKKGDLYNRYLDTKNYDIYVEFSVDLIEYTLTKKVTSSTKVILTRAGEDISGHTATQTYKTLEKIMGLDFPTFTKLVYQSMISSLDFMTATDANRKKFLISLLGLERYVEAEKTIKEVTKSTKSDLAEIQGSVNTIKQWLADFGEVPQEKSHTKVPPTQEGLEEAISTRKSDLTNIDMANKLARAAISRKQGYESIKPMAEVPEPDMVKAQTISDRYQKSKTELAVKESELRKLKAVKLKCPTCGTRMEIGDTLALIEELEPQVDSIQKDVEHFMAYNNTMVKRQKEYKNYGNYLEGLWKANDLYNREDSVEILDAGDLQTDINTIQKEIAIQTRAVKEAEAYNHKVDIHNSTIDFKKQTLETHRLSLNEKARELEDIQVLVAKLEVIGAAFGTKGLIAYKIESMVKVFEKLINDYLQVLADGRFALVFVVEDTKLALKLYDSGIEIDIKSLSSGEFNKVNTATLLAVRKMMSSISKVNINILFLDEVVSVLDANGKDTLMEVLLREKDLNSLVVSHGYSHPLADTLAVVKTDKISRIVHEQ